MKPKKFSMEILKKSDNNLHKTNRGFWGSMKHGLSINRTEAVREYFKREKKLQQQTKKIRLIAKETYEKQKGEVDKEYDDKIDLLKAQKPQPADLKEQIEAVEAERKEKKEKLQENFEYELISSQDKARAVHLGNRYRKVQDSSWEQYTVEQAERKEGAEKALKESKEEIDKLRPQLQEKVLGIEQRLQQLEEKYRESIQLNVNKNRSASEVVHGYINSATKSIETKDLIQQRAQEIQLLVNSIDTPAASEMSALVSDFRGELPALIANVKKSLYENEDQNRNISVITGNNYDKEKERTKECTNALRNLARDIVQTFHANHPYHLAYDNTNKKNYMHENKIQHYEGIIDEGLSYTEGFLKMYADRKGGKDDLRTEISSLRDQLQLLPGDDLSANDRTTKEKLEQQIGYLNKMLDLVECRPIEGPGTLPPLAERPAVELSLTQREKGETSLRDYFLNVHIEDIVRQEQASLARESFERTKVVESTMKQISGWMGQLEGDRIQALAESDTQKVSQIRQKQVEIFQALEQVLPLYSDREAEKIAAFLGKHGHEIPSKEALAEKREQAIKDQKKYAEVWLRSEDIQRRTLLISEQDHLFKDLSFDTHINDGNRKLDTLKAKIIKLATQKAGFFSETETNSRLDEAEEEAKKQALKDPKNKERIEHINNRVEGVLDDALHKTISTSEIENIDINEYLKEEALKVRLSLKKGDGALGIQNFVKEDPKVQVVINTPEINQKIDDLAARCNAPYAESKKPESDRVILDQEAIKTEIHSALDATVDCYVQTYKDNKTANDIAIEEDLIAEIKRNIRNAKDITNAQDILIGNKSNKGNIEEDDASRKILIQGIVKTATEHASGRIREENVIAQKRLEAQDDFFSIRNAKTYAWINDHRSLEEKTNAISALTLNTLIESARLDANLSIRQNFREQEMKRALNEKITPRTIQQIQQAVKNHPGTTAFFEKLAKEENTSTIQTTIQKINAIHSASASTIPTETRTPSEILNKNIGQEIEYYIKDYAKLTNKHHIQIDKNAVERIKSEVQYAPAYKRALTVVTDGTLSGDETTKNDQRATAIHLAFQEAIQHTAQIMAYQKKLQGKHDEIALHVEGRVEAYFESKAGKKELEAAESAAIAKVQKLAEDTQSATYKAIEGVSNANVDDKTLLYAKVKEILPDVMREYISGVKGDEARAEQQKYEDTLKPARHDPELVKMQKEKYAEEEKRLEASYKRKIEQSENEKETREKSASLAYVKAEDHYKDRIQSLQRAYEQKVEDINNRAGTASGGTEQKNRAIATLTFELNRQKTKLKEGLDQAKQTRDMIYKTADYDHRQLLMKREAAYSAVARKYPLARESQIWDEITSVAKALEAEIVATKDLLQQRDTQITRLEGAQAVMPTFSFNYTHERHRMYEKMRNAYNAINGELDPDGKVKPGCEGIIQAYKKAEEAYNTAKREKDHEKHKVDDVKNKVANLIVEKTTLLAALKTTQDGFDEHYDNDHGKHDHEVHADNEEEREQNERAEAEEKGIQKEIIDKLEKKEKRLEEINNKKRSIHIKNELALALDKLRILEETLGVYEKAYHAKKQVYSKKEELYNNQKAEKDAATARLAAVKFEYDWVCKRDDVEDARWFHSRDIIHAAMVYEERAVRHEAMAQRAYEQALIMAFLQYANQNMMGQRNAIFTKSNQLYQ